MKYEWESQAKRRLQGGVKSSPPYYVIGLAVVNVNNGEAALFDFSHGVLSGVDAADAWGDVSGDAARLYDGAVERLRREMIHLAEQNGTET